MLKTLEIYYADILVNTVVVAMDDIARSAVIKEVQVHTDKPYLSFFGEMVENCVDFLNRRSYLSRFEYYTTGETSGFVLYTAVEILLKTHGLSETDKYWFKEVSDCIDYSTVCEIMGKAYKGYYGITKREFEGGSVITTYKEKAKQRVLGNLIVNSFLKEMSIIDIPELQAFSADTVVYANVCGENEFLVSAYDLLLRNFDYGVFGYAKAQPIITFNNIVKLLNEAVGFDVREYLSKFLFLDSLFLNEGHYFANIYFACNEETGCYRLLPYMSCGHILGIEKEVLLQDKAKVCYGRTICANFDVIGLLMVKQGIVLPSYVKVPLKKLISFEESGEKMFDIVDITEICAIIGYRYQQLTGGTVEFDDER